MKSVVIMATCLISIQVRDNIDPIEQLMGNYKQIILYLFTLNEILAQKVSIQMDILTTMQCIAMVYVDYGCWTLPTLTLSIVTSCCSCREIQAKGSLQKILCQTEG